MFKLKELLHILIAIIIIAFVMSFLRSFNFFLTMLLSALILLAINILSKKATAYYLGANTETKIWSMQRYWVYAKSHFKKPIPAGIIFPFILSVFSLGWIKWLAITEFDVRASKSRVTKKHGLYRFSEMTEWHIALIAAVGIFANLIAAVVAYILGFEEFTRLSIYFCCFNLVPISKLDGTKIFFGSIVLWSVLAAICLIGLLYALFLV